MRLGVVIGIVAGVVVLILVGVLLFVLLDDDDDDEDGADFEATMSAVEDDLDDFWERRLEENGFESRYQSPDSVSYYDDEVEETECGETTPGNAFYCPLDNTIYLHQPFLETAFEEEGPFAPVFVLAHEWAHLVQRGLEIRTGAETSVEMELQADCLAGYYAYELNESDLITEEDLLQAGTAFIQNGDPANPWWDPAVHGSPEQRIESYTLGYEEDLEFCFADPLPSPNVPRDGDEETAEPTETPTEETDEDGDEGTGNGDGAEDEATIVSLSDNQFEPRELEVEAGTTVVWEWGGENPHSVVGTSQNSGFLDSGVMTGSGTYEATFDEPGTYEYQCGIHGTAMSARVIVS